MGESKARETISCLTKEAIREGKNKRQGEDGQGSGSGYSGGYSTGNQTGGSYGRNDAQQSKIHDLGQRLLSPKQIIRRLQQWRLPAARIHVQRR